MSKPYSRSEKEIFKLIESQEEVDMEFKTDDAEEIVLVTSIKIAREIKDNIKFKKPLGFYYKRSIT